MSYSQKVLGEHKSISRNGVVNTMSGNTTIKS